MTRDQRESTSIRYEAFERGFDVNALSDDELLEAFARQDAEDARSPAAKVKFMLYPAVQVYELRAVLWDEPECAR